MNTSTKQYGFVPVGEGYSRSFWTKRKRSTTSMLAVIGLIVGIAVAYKLFEQEVPNNVVRDASSFDYLIEKSDPAFEVPLNVERSNPSATANVYVPATGTNPVFRTDPFPAGPNLYPGDSRLTAVRVTNTNALPARDASFQVYVDDITVTDTWDQVNNVPLGTPVVIASTDQDWTYFVNLFTLTIDKEAVQGSGPFGDIFYDGSYVQACQAGLLQIKESAPCDKGIIRASGTKSFLDDDMDVRHYKYRIAEADDGSDQSFFKGWQVQFTLVYQARLPAVEPSIVLVDDRP